MQTTFSRRDLRGSRCRVLRRGRWANADVYLVPGGGCEWVVKDFSPCARLVRETWGRLLVRRECRTLSRLNGIEGIPQAPFRIDAHAFGYRYIPGATLREAGPAMVDAGFFRRLETLVHAMHRRHIVHLDIRNRRNVLVSEKGGPGLLDFQSSLNLDHVPRRIHRFLKEIDISGVYKLWELNDPASMDAERKARLAAVNRKRGLWVFKGYPLGTRKAPRQ